MSPSRPPVREDNLPLQSHPAGGTHALTSSDFNQALVRAALHVALAAIPDGAFLVEAETLALIDANASARSAIQRSLEITTATLRAAIAGLLPEIAAVTRVEAPHSGKWVLVVLHEGVAGRERHLAEMALQWRLTRRQAEVLGALAKGLSNKEIAARFRCRAKTVEKHVTALFLKAGASSRTTLLAALHAPRRKSDGPTGQAPGGEKL
jgi:DNA-binding CsgD family transcriptional regulator